MKKSIANDTRPFDAARYLEDDAAIATYLDEAMATRDVDYIVQAIGTAARARGMTQIAKDTQLSRESLYKALGSGGNPEFATVLRVMGALGMRLGVEPAKAES